MKILTAGSRPAPSTSRRRASAPHCLSPHRRLRAMLPASAAPALSTLTSTSSLHVSRSGGAGRQAQSKVQALPQAQAQAQTRVRAGPQTRGQSQGPSRPSAAMSASAGASTARVCTRGRVLSAPPEDSDWWDRATISGPVVIPPLETPTEAESAPGAQGGTPASGEALASGQDAEGEGTFWEGPIPDTMWRMYYCGRDSDMWGQGVKALPTAPYGRVGLAVSRDGLHWRRFKGPLPGGAIFDPASDPAAFDSVHVSASDIIPPLSRLPGQGKAGGAPEGTGAGAAEGEGGDDLWRMYYFGGGLREGQVPDFVLAGKPEATITSLPFRIGLATSTDGVVFHRHPEAILSEGTPGDVDEYSVNFPRVLPPRERAGASRFPASAPSAGNLDGSWYMTYHTRSIEEVQGQPRASFTACLALSADGVAWDKKGGLLSGGGPGSWDEEGVGLRHIKKIDGTYYMLYTGVSKANEYAIGLATSPDGVTWTRAEGAGPKPGGPVLRARKGEAAWDNFAVGAPYLVERPNGEIWMYYFGATQQDGRDIAGVGVAVNRSRDCRSWERLEF